MNRKKNRNNYLSFVNFTTGFVKVFDAYFDSFFLVVINVAAEVLPVTLLEALEHWMTTPMHPRLQHNTTILVMTFKGPPPFQVKGI